MTTEEKAALKKKIVDLIQKSEADLVELEEMTQPIKPENSLGRVSRMDAINNKSVIEAAQRNKKAKLSKLRLALSNIDTKDFGICSNCNKPIQQGRLIFLPESTKCIHCASR